MTEQNSTAGGQSKEETQLTLANGDPLPYGDAIEELEAILAELDASAVDVDHLAERVRRASDLVRYCRDRLDVVRADVAEVVANLDGDADADG